MICVKLNWSNVVDNAASDSNYDRVSAWLIGTCGAVAVNVGKDLALFDEPRFREFSKKYNNCIMDCNTELPDHVVFVNNADSWELITNERWYAPAHDRFEFSVFNDSHRGDVLLFDTEYDMLEFTLTWPEAFNRD